MATYVTSPGLDKNAAGFDARGVYTVTRNEVVLDFAKIKAARAAAGATALAAADVLEVISLPAGSVVLAAGLEVVSAETVNTTATLDLGAAGAYANDLATNALGMAAAGTSTVFTAADTLDVLINTAVPQDAVVRAFAVVANLK